MRKPSRICESQWTSDVSCIFWIVSLSICYWLVSDNLSLQKSRWNVRIEIYIQNTYRQQVTKTSPHKPVCERYLLSGSALHQAHKINYCTCIGTCSLQKRVRAVRAYIYIICTYTAINCALSNPLHFLFRTLCSKFPSKYDTIHPRSMHLLIDRFWRVRFQWRGERCELQCANWK